MSYTRTVWEDQVTWVDAEHLNNIEEGIAEALESALSASYEAGTETLVIQAGASSSGGGTVFCDALPDTGQENVLYIVKSLAAAYIWIDGTWVPLAGGDALPLYTGDVTVIPKVGEEQVLETASKTMADDVTVTKIPISDVTNDFGGTTVTIG